MGRSAAPGESPSAGAGTRSKGASISRAQKAKNVRDLATCPYCLEAIQRLALRCKHCHATLNGTEAPHVADHGTVGGAAGVTIGGQGHHIEGGIHLTLAELDGVDEPTKRQLRIRFEAQ